MEATHLLSPQADVTCGFVSDLILNSATKGSKCDIVLSVRAVSSHCFNCALPLLSFGISWLLKEKNSSLVQTFRD